MADLKQIQVDNYTVSKAFAATASSESPKQIQVDNYTVSNAFAATASSKSPKRHTGHQCQGQLIP